MYCFYSSYVVTEGGQKGTGWQRRRLLNVPLLLAFCANCSGERSTGVTVTILSFFLFSRACCCLLPLLPRHRLVGWLGKIEVIDVKKYLVKWSGLSYQFCTWETREEVSLKEVFDAYCVVCRVE